MEEIIKDLEHTIKYFENAQNDFQRGRVFQAEKILEALRKPVVAGQSEQLVCPDCKRKNIEIRHKQQSFRCRDCGEGWAN